jgi:hypothetical protein
MYLDLRHAIFELPGFWATFTDSAGKSYDDFYGVEIRCNPDGSTTTIRHGGYEPRPFTDEQLEAWMRVAYQAERRRLLAEGESTAAWDAGVSSDWVRDAERWERERAEHEAARKAAEAAKPPKKKRGRPGKK